MTPTGWTVLAAPLLLLALAGCAGDGHGPPPQLERGERNLFISPAGQPFRAGPNDDYPVARWFAGADRDHDGRLSAEEFRADAEAFLKTLDTDHDGVVDGFETAAYELSMPEILPRVAGLRVGEGQNPNLGGVLQLAQPRREAEGGRQRLGGRQGAGQFGLLDEPQPVTATDTDFDSRITVAETRAASDRRFALLDKDHDGFLSLAELPKTPVQALQLREAQDGRRTPGSGAVEPRTGDRARSKP